MKNARVSLKSLALGSCALGALMAAAPAAAEEFAVEAQSLQPALQQFASQGDQQVLFSSAAVAGKSTAGFTGEASPETALQQLLSGTDLVWSKTADGALLVMTQAEAQSRRPQFAQAADGGSDGTVEALIVTAQKREEDIQDVPIAISAFTQEQLERSQVAGGPDLMTQVPNMTFTKTNFTSYSIQIRGIGTQAISATTDAAVAVAFNNTPFIQNRFFEQEFYDLQRVEVLRGPQGTLYGRNATAGVVNIISQKPKFVAEAKLSGDVSNYSTTRLEGMVNIPLVEDTVALRLAGAWTKREGYATNEITGNPIDGRDLWSTRVSLRFSPNDALDVNLIWEHFEENDDRLRSGKQLCKKHVITDVGDFFTDLPFFLPLSNAGVEGQPFVSTQSTFSQGCIRESLYSPDSFQTPNGVSVPYYVPLGALGLPVTRFDPYASQTQSRDLRVIESTVDPKYRAMSDLAELQISWDVTDTLTLSSETGYNSDFTWSTQDFNRFNTAPGAWFNPATDGPGSRGQNLVEDGVLEPDGSFIDPQVGRSDRLVAVDLATQKGRQFNQEFRLGSDFDGPFNFSVGANFTRYDTEAKYYVFINSLNLLSAALGTSDDFEWTPGVSDNRECQVNGLLPGDPTGLTPYGYSCVYVENNSIENIQDQGHNYFLSKNPYRLISYAVFGEAYYNITDNLKVTAGLRWTVDKKHAPRIPSWLLAGSTDSNGNTVGVGSRGYPVRDILEQEWREPTGRLTLDWKPDLAFTDETLLYASYAHGYKAGGANPPPYMQIGQGARYYGNLPPSETRPLTFDAEFIDAYELGAKNTLLDGRMTLNLAAFYYDYTGYQISEIVDRSAFNRNFDAEVWGLEIEADWRPLENLKLGFKGGYENTRIKDGESAVDLMDRTAGHEDWLLIRPFPTFASSCILPMALFTHTGVLQQAPGEPGIELTSPPRLVTLGSQGGGGAGPCELAYQAGYDPVTALPYDGPFPTEEAQAGNPGVLAVGTLGQHWPVGTYPGWNPAWAPNNGEGFSKQLGGNELPNAPNFTATITADYTVPLPNEWLATLHTDLYWQSESWWRVFNDHEFNRLDEYFTMNVAAIFANEDAGWKVMAYIKNVFDRDSITGAFLNSDDTGLTTNVFLTEPRLYGLRVTKEWTGGPLFGSFGARREGPYPFTVELGGQVQRHDAPNSAIAPSFIGDFSPELNPTADQQQDLDWGDGREVKLTWQPDDLWKVSLGARFGKTNGSVPWSDRSEFGDQICEFPLATSCQNPESGIGYSIRSNYTISSTTDREEHTFIDFMVGREVGFGELLQSTLSGGVRYADIGSTTNAHIFGVTNWDFSSLETKYPSTSSHDRYDAMIDADREFKGAGPVLNWEASQRLLGNEQTGTLGVDWSLTGGVLFGKRKTSVTGIEVHEEFYEAATFYSSLGVQDSEIPVETTTLPPVNFQRSEDVSVPTFGATLGISYKVDRFAIGAGYRWERYQDAIDGGYAETKEEHRTIDGPYFKVSLGFGG